MMTTALKSYFYDYLYAVALPDDRHYNDRIRRHFHSAFGSMKETKSGLFGRLAKTRELLGKGLAGLLRPGVKLDSALFDELEDQLLLADLGVEATSAIMDVVRDAAGKRRIGTADELLTLLRERLAAMLQPAGGRLELGMHKPTVILMVGVNGVGKTTTAAKLAHRFQQRNASVMLAACDTFRAAAIEQLQAWGTRLAVPVIAQQHGADAAAVAHDALSAALARRIDVLIIDTAGRQHTHAGLMDQLRKLERVLAALMPGAPHETLLTVDAGTGQNALSQTERFHATVPLTGLCVTKLDGTAKGGVVVALARRFALPIRFIGVGEGLDDLREFEAAEFANALLPASLG